jgi:hypothetical protein
MNAVTQAEQDALHDRAIADAQDRTMAAKQAIRAIRNLSPRDVTELLSCIQARIAESGWSHQECATDADDYLTSAHYVLELAAEREERE